MCLQVCGRHRSRVGRWLTGGGRQRLATMRGYGMRVAASWEQGTDAARLSGTRLHRALLSASRESLVKGQVRREGRCPGADIPVHIAVLALWSGG